MPSNELRILVESSAIRVTRVGALFVRCGPSAPNRASMGNFHRSIVSEMLSPANSKRYNWDQLLDRLMRQTQLI